LSVKISSSGSQLTTTSINFY